MWKSETMSGEGAKVKVCVGVGEGVRACVEHVVEVGKEAGAMSES